LKDQVDGQVTKSEFHKTPFYTAKVDIFAFDFVFHEGFLVGCLSNNFPV